MGEFKDAQLVTFSVVCFALGFIAGYQFGNLRRKWLQAKRDYLQRKLEETKRRLDVA